MKQPDFKCNECNVTITEDENGTRTNYCKHYPPKDGMMIQSSFHPQKRNNGKDDVKSVPDQENEIKSV